MKDAIIYHPKRLIKPERILNIGSAWIGLETILFDIIKDFHVTPNIAVEFGVETGYSLAAIANYFGEVIGVDHFAGLGHDPEVLFPQVINAMRPWPNVSLLRASWEDFAQIRQGPFDMIHIDMDHNYEQTYKAGDWAVQHSRLTIFHDTLSWPDVYRACGDLAEKYDMFFYNFEDCHGLGILSRWRQL